MTLTMEQECKLYLLARGIAITPEAEAAWLERYGGPLSLSEYASTSGIHLRLPENVYVNAPFIELFADQSEAALIIDGAGFAVTWPQGQLPAAVIPVASYHHQTFEHHAGRFPYSSLAVTHTDRCRIAPVGGCSMICQFCNIPYEERYRLQPEEALVQAVRLAVADPVMPARHILVSGGTPREEDEPWLDQIFGVIARAVSVPVDVMMTPRRDLDYPAFLRQAGINTLSINLEIVGEGRARALTPTKARQFGFAYYLKYLERAVEVFGVGHVQSLLLVGEAMEPLQSTLRGVEALAAIGVIPVLSPFRPDLVTPLRALSPVSLLMMQRAYEKAVLICERAGTGVRPGPRCEPCMHNTVAFPDRAGFSVPLEGDLRSALH